MVQTLARCRSCGLPGKLAESLDWSHDGAIVLSRRKSIRLVLLDQDTMLRIHAAFDAEMGEAFFIQTLKDATHLMTANVVTGLKGKLSRYGMAKKRTLEAIEDYSIILGMGRIEIEKFTPVVQGSISLRKPFDIWVITAGVSGVLEEMDRCYYRSEYSESSSGDYRLVLEARETEDSRAKSVRDYAFTPTAIKAMGRQESCQLCGLPTSVAGLRWDELYGTIDAGPGGRRVAFLPAYILEALEDLDSGMVGDNSRGIIEEAVYESTLSSLEDGIDDEYGGKEELAGNGDSAPAWSVMSMRGWGTVTESAVDRDVWRATVLNPVSEALIAGWLRALYSFTVGRNPRMDISKERSMASFELA
jgi:hypothetical protein